ncbi:hypothetical protein LINGRAPRIM_LOCUS801, partial [Linum grandiflorum]
LGCLQYYNSGITGSCGGLRFGLASWFSAARTANRLERRISPFVGGRKIDHQHAALILRFKELHSRH